MFRPCLHRPPLPASLRIIPIHRTKSHRASFFSATACASQLQHHPPVAPASRPKRIVIGITGATGSVYAIRLLQILRDLEIESHLIISKWALATLKYETGHSEATVRALAHASYAPRDMSATIASGSFAHDGMIIVPCSMKTLAAVRMGFCDELIARAADVSLKEDRRLVLAVRETPLTEIHLDNMLALRRMGAVIFPPVPAFYTRPKEIGDLVEQSVGRMLDALGLATEGFPRWRGFEWEVQRRERDALQMEERERQRVGYSCS
ncbi:hypothetical protein FE257_008848 [Aspergillus nanangensis]|uniref:Flavin prenyltransferase PAD1, mitochondrial n=1 Tax=Aspergillus nanangensis TaxID=2582783 RepID=A0AAD4CL77_ASPNN|nr:hypothetical protein FE257_008848 [Aspergillus nanangensis]